MIVDARFTRLVEKTATCWLWTGTATRRIKGYGQFERKGKRMLAHRAAYEFAHGAIPGDFEVCHRCDVSLCVNPDHLFLGSHKDNMRDAATKGRIAEPSSQPPMKRGSDNGHSLLDESAVLEIRRRIAAGEVQRRLAAEYGVSVPTISAIHKRRIWAWL